MGRRKKGDREVITKYHLETFDPDGKTVDIFDPPLVYRTRMRGRGTFGTLYKLPSGKRRWYKIGRYPEMSLVVARAKAAKVQVDVAAGADPGAPKVLDRGTFSHFVDVYLNQRADQLRGGAEMRRAFNVSIVPKLGHRQMSEITRGDIVMFLDQFVAEGKPALANRIHEYVRAMLSWHVKRGALEENAASGIPKPGGKLKPRDRVLNEEEIAAIWAVPESPFKTFVKVALLTAQRRGSVAAMRWADLDLEAGTWSIPASDMKMDRPHLVPLSQQATAILGGIERRGEYVFGKDGKTPYSGFSRSLARLRKASGTDCWTVHDCRRTATTLMAPATIPDVLRAILDHAPASNDMLQRVYNQHDYAGEKRKALDVLGRKIDAIVTGETADNVVEIEARV